MNDATSPVMLITGGSGSIGRVIARHALDAGWRVVLHGRRQESVAAALDALRHGAHCHGVSLDVAEPSAAEQLVAQALSWGDRLDAVVDCVAAGPAGAQLTGPISQTDADAYGKFLDLSVGHLQRLARAGLPHLARRCGTLIAFASDAGRFAAPGQALIAASRAGIMAFIRNLALETANDGVTAHCISPGFVDRTTSAERLTERSAARLNTARVRAGLGLPTPDDLAPLVLFLCGAGARRITGQVISVNGGTNA